MIWDARLLAEVDDVRLLRLERGVGQKDGREDLSCVHRGREHHLVLVEGMAVGLCLSSASARTSCSVRSRATEKQAYHHIDDASEASASIASSANDALLSVHIVVVVVVLSPESAVRNTVYRRHDALV